MKVEQHSIKLAGQHTYSRVVSETGTLRAWVGGQRPDFEAMGGNAGNAESSAKVAISEAARQAAAAATAHPQGAMAPKNGPEHAAAVESVNDAAVNDPKLGLLIKIIEALTGKKVKLMDTTEIRKLSVLEDGRAHAELETASRKTSDQSVAQGWGLEFDYHEERYESERTSFTARGDIMTADGKRLQFDIMLQMSRQHYDQTSYSLRVGDAVRKDPLVINFDGNAADLSGQKFDFDIDADGQADTISFVGPGSGFLVFDRNSNGEIDDGGELFGARTGNGFAELAVYDTDGNGWIDENDAIFAQLRIWTKNNAGDDHLSPLAERNVGALYLGHVATPFDLKDQQNRQQGQILSTGIYVSEDGGLGTMQQLDLFV